MTYDTNLNDMSTTTSVAAATSVPTRRRPRSASRPRWRRWAGAVIAAGAVVAGAMTALPAPAAQAHSNGPITLLVHGFQINGGKPMGSDCSVYWGKLPFDHAATSLHHYLEVQKHRRVFTVGLYRNSKNCDMVLTDSTWPTQDNTMNTSIDVLGDELARLLTTHPALRNKTVDIVAHSMGGLVVRDALDDHGAQLKVDDVVTLGTPHAGAKLANLAGAFGVSDGVCQHLIRQCRDMMTGSTFLDSLEHNPQSSVPTKWTTIGTYHDEVIGSWSGTMMQRGGYWKPTVREHYYSSVMRYDNNCWGLARLSHGALTGNGSVGYCTSTGFHEVHRPGYRVWLGIRNG